VSPEWFLAVSELRQRTVKEPPKNRRRTVEEPPRSLSRSRKEIIKFRSLAGRHSEALPKNPSPPPADYHSQPQAASLPSGYSAASFSTARLRAGRTEHPRAIVAGQYMTDHTGRASAAAGKRSNKSSNSKKTGRVSIIETPPEFAVAGLGAPRPYLATA